MKKLLLLMPLIAFADIETVEGSHYHYVEISQTDINRVVCPYEITGVVYSKEKSIEVKRKGNNAWIKILPTKRGEEIEYPSYPRELYIECGGKVFSLVLLPKKKPASTIVLKLPHEDRKAARDFERKAESYEKLLLSLIKHVYKEIPPPGYSVKNVRRKVKEFRELSLYLLRRYEGDRYVVEEYLIEAKEDIDLDEGAFIPHIRYPVALTIVHPSLKKGQSTRLIAVRGKD